MLFIIGLSVAVVGPRLPLMADRLDFALKRDTLIGDLDGLTYQAFRESRDIVLVGVYDQNGLEVREGDAKPAQITRPGLSLLSRGERAVMAPVATTPAKVKLLPGWRLTIADPIYFRSSGYCTGGRAELEIGRALYQLTFQTPQCSVRVEE